MKYPARHTNHSLEEKSITFLRNHLPEDWNVNSIDRDYGQDLNLEICEDGVYKGLELILQLKSSHETNEIDGTERQTFKVGTYNYLNGNLRVVMVIKFVESENESYYILLKDVDEPNQENETFTLYIPKENRLSTINWNEITDYVRSVTDKKLAAMRAQLK
ncbi:MAG: DUF4365 domain-containing protein [Bacteroidota bacterium]